MADTRVIGLGLIPDESRHGFLLRIPASQKAEADVLISEHRDWVFDQGELQVPPVSPSDPHLRVRLSRNRWEALAPAFWEDATRRLRKNGLGAAKLPKKGDVPVHPSLGKELCVLCWAVELADPAMIPEALRNWEGLAPEERWWLYTMTAAATGQAMQSSLGWRKALRFALTENPLIKGEGMAPRTRKDLLDHGQMNLL